MVLLFIRAPFYVLLVFVAMCAVFWLFWLSYQYLTSDWLERFVCVPIFCVSLGSIESSKFKLSTRTSALSDCNFVTRMLFKTKGYR